MVASEVVDHGVVGTQSGIALGSSIVDESVSSTQVEHLPRESGRPQASRLATIAQSAQNAGFSKEVADRVARGKLRKSSLNVYESRWNIFVRWCDERKINPWRSSVQQISEFLLHLYKGGNLKVRTIEGYRAAISSSLKLSGVAVGTNSFLSDLIASFYIDRPIERNLIPQWDLSVVLDALTRHPFESRDMNSIQLKFLTLKTVFLLALASGARRGEIHALDVTRTRWSQDGYEVILRPYAGFLPKTYLAHQPGTVLSGFRIRCMAKGLI